MNESERRLKAQLDANTAALARTQQQLQHINARQQSQYDDYDGGGYQGNPGDPYGSPDPNQLVLQAITSSAAKQAAKAVTTANNYAKQQEDGVKTRMTRLVADFPALTEEGSSLIHKSRETYARIKVENPGLDEASRYELAVREAAAAIGARPVTTPAEDLAWTMPAGENPALAKKQTRSRLTPAIVQNAALMGINVDPKTKEGQLNLKELSAYSARFNADVNEEHLRYR